MKIKKSILIVLFILFTLIVPTSVNAVVDNADITYETSKCGESDCIKITFALPEGTLNTEASYEFGITEDTEKTPIWSQTEEVVTTNEVSVVITETVMNNQNLGMLKNYETLYVSLTCWEDESAVIKIFEDKEVNLN